MQRLIANPPLQVIAHDAEKVVSHTEDADVEVLRNIRRCHALDGRGFLQVDILNFSVGIDQKPELTITRHVDPAVGHDRHLTIEVFVWKVLRQFVKPANLVQRHVTPAKNLRVYA